MQQLQFVLDAAKMVVWDSTLVDGDVMSSIVHWTPDGSTLLGLPARARDMAFREYLDFVHVDDRVRIVAAMQTQVDACEGYEVSYRILVRGAQERWVRAKAHTLCSDKIATGTLGLIWDDTERKQQDLIIQEQKELAETTLAAIGDAVIRTDWRGRVLSLNRVAEELTGWSEHEACGRDIDDLMRLVDDISQAVLTNPVHRSLEARAAIGVGSNAKMITRDGRVLSVEDSAAPIWSRDAQLLGVVAVFRDVSHERQLAHQVRWQAAHDALTGLINRREFESEVTRFLGSAKEEGHQHALLYLDLDRFKIVNDTCGHGAGDVLLQTLCRMLQERMRDSDILARLGGDELGVLLTHCPLPRAIKLANNLRQAIRDFRFSWDGRTFELGVSIGLVGIERDSTNTTELLKAADQACYLAKESGRNRVHIYRESDVLLARRRGEVQWVTRLHEALAHDHFILFGQPIVPLHGMDEHHEEVLLRIGNVADGMTLPGAFIPAAERYDLMTALDRWVIKHVCRHLAQERKVAKAQTSDGTAEVVAIPAAYSVNLSGTSLSAEGMFDYIVDVFDQYDIDPRQICFEITETAVIANLLIAQDFIGRLRQLGCMFSLDDFGSGLSSFAYLRSLPVDYLKIDGVFIRDIVNNPVNRAMVKAINEVGHVMGIRTVAEFVEDLGTLDMVRELGIDYAQGYAVGQLRHLHI